MAEVAKTLPCVPAANTETDAISTMMSADRQKRHQPLPRLLHSHIHAPTDLPITQNGFRANFSRPRHPL